MIRKVMVGLTLLSALTGPLWAGQPFTPSVMMDVEKHRRDTELNLLQYFYPAVPPHVQARYAHRSSNREVNVQQVQWQTLMTWSYKQPAYYLPGYVFLGITSWAIPMDVAKTMGGFEAASEYGETASTARKIGADYAVYSQEWTTGIPGAVLHMQAAYYAKVK